VALTDHARPLLEQMRVQRAAPLRAFLSTLSVDEPNVFIDHLHALVDAQLSANAPSEGATTVSPDVLRGWSDFTRLLDNHHRGEDDFLWPIARRCPGGDTRHADSLDRMRAEHSELDPLLTQVGRGWTDTTGNVANALEQLHVKLDEHLQDEEERVLPWPTDADRVPAQSFRRHYDAACLARGGG
jgi:hypothetical protein